MVKRPRAAPPNRRARITVQPLGVATDGRSLPLTPGRLPDTLNYSDTLESERWSGTEQQGG